CEGGFLVDALRLLNALAEKLPTDADVFHSRAEVKNDLHDVSGALKDYDKAVALDESNADILLGRGEFFEKLGFLDKALADYETAITKDPESADGYFCRGYIRINLKDYKGALEDLNRSIELDECDDAEKYARRGFLKLMLGREQEATRDFEKANTL